MGFDVTVAGMYREPGLIRAGADPRVAIAARRRSLEEQIESLAPAGAPADSAAQGVKEAEAAHAGLRTRAAGATSLEESKRLLEAAREAEGAEAAKLPELDRASSEAEDAAAANLRERETLAVQRASALQAELERARWRDRREDLERQLASIAEDLARHRNAADERAKRVADAEA